MWFSKNLDAGKNRKKIILEQNFRGTQKREIVFLRIDVDFKEIWRQAKKKICFLRTDVDFKENWRKAKKKNSFLRTDVNFKKKKFLEHRCGFQRNMEASKKQMWILKKFRGKQNMIILRIDVIAKKFEAKQKIIYIF